MSFNEFDDDIWDENQWELHINEAEQKSEALRQYLEGTLGKEPPRWMKLMKEHTDKDEVVDTFIEEELMFEEAYFPDDEDDWDFEDDDEDDDFFASDDYQADGQDEFPDDPLMDEEGEEWKALSENYLMTNHGDIENWSVYNRAHELAVYFLKFADHNPAATKDAQFVEIITNTMQIGAKLAGGYAFGFDVDSIGGNIVYCKKALHLANHTLELLQAQKNKAYLKRFEYAAVHAQMFEVRNDIGVHIQELRESFAAGL